MYPDITQILIIREVAERHCGDDTIPQYLKKLARTCQDMIDGKTVRKWRLDRLLEYCEDLSITTLNMISRPGCTTIRM